MPTVTAAVTVPDQLVQTTLTTVILTASSNCLIATLTSADAKSSMIKGFLNWNKRNVRKQ